MIDDGENFPTHRRWRERCHSARRWGTLCLPPAPHRSEGRRTRAHTHILYIEAQTQHTLEGNDTFAHDASTSVLNTTAATSW